MSQETLDRLSRIKVKLMMKGGNVFLSTLILNLRTKIDESVGTACTDGITITYAPSYIATLNDEELLSLVAHEAWHVALVHMYRVGDRQFQRFNAAADYAINGMLAQAGFKIPSNWLHDAKYYGKSSEEIYDMLPADKKGQPSSGQGQGQSGGAGTPNPQSGDFQKPEDGTGEDATGTGQSAGERAVEDLVVKAATAASMAGEAGSLPSEIARAIDKLLNPKLPWNVILQNYMSAKIKAEKSWSRRNRRYRDVCVAGRLAHAMGNVNIYVDASGSVSQSEFTSYITEMHDIRESLRPSLMKVIAFDTRIGDEFVMEQGEEIAVSFTGGGGTCIEPVVAHAAEEETDVTIIFTDGYFSDADYTRIPNDVLFVIVDNPSWTCTATNATVIHMSTKNE